MKCEHCGAPARDGGAFCSHCGGRFKRTETPGHLAVVAPARFEQAEAHPSYKPACEHRPAERPITEIGGPIAGILAGVCMLIFMIVLATRASTRPGDAAGMTMMGLLALAIIVWASVMLMVARTRRNAPIERDVRVVVDERSGVVGGKHQRSVYFATLQTRDGARVEFDCEDWLAARIANGDIGVAFMQAGSLIDFVRIEV